MKNKLLPYLSLAFLCYPIADVFANEPDSAYIFSYATEINKGRNGLHFAWSVDNENWNQIGSEHSFLKSDFGSWGDQKRMIDPVLVKDDNNLWHCLWSLNEKDGVFAHTYSKDLVYWKPQAYHYMDSPGNCIGVEASVFNSGNEYLIS